MKLSELKAAAGSRSLRTRKGRGRSSKGKTAGRGQKGQGARGNKTRIGFEGGQMPLYRRMPKRGFTNINRKEYEIVSLSDLNQFDAGSEITPKVLIKANLIKGNKDGVKILANGKINKKLTVKANKFSKTAESAIKNAGGKAEVI